SVRQVSRRHLTTGQLADVVETDMPDNRGNSRGPVVNDRGELVAMVEGPDPDARQVSLLTFCKALMEGCTMFFDTTSPRRNRVSSALVGAFSGERRSRPRPRRCARKRLLAIDRLIEPLEDRKLLDASPIAHPTFVLYGHGGAGSLQLSSPSNLTPSVYGFT